MERRLELHEKLCTVLGSRYCYFQPPENIKLNYDCIVYKFDGIDDKRANNKWYNRMKRYEAVVIFQDPDSDFITPMLDTFQYCKPGTPYVSDNLYHQVFEIYW